MSIQSIDILISFSVCTLIMIFIRKQEQDIDNHKSQILREKKYKERIRDTLYSNRIFFIIVPATFYLLSNLIQFSSFLKYLKYSPNEFNNRFEFKSVIELYDLKDILNYVILNLDNSIFRIVSFFNTLKLPSIIIIPILLFYQFKNRKKRISLRVYIIALFLVMIVLMKYISNFNYNSRLVVNILGDTIGLISIYFTAYLYCFVYILILNGYFRSEYSLLNNLIKMDEKVNKVFVVLIIRHLISSISYFLFKYINIEIELNYLFSIINSVMSIVLLVLIPELIWTDNTMKRSMIETKNLIIKNLFPICKLVMFYTFLYMLVFYFKKSIVSNNHTLYNLLSFMILFPLYIYSLFHFNFNIFDMIKKNNPNENNMTESSA